MKIHVKLSLLTTLFSVSLSCFSQKMLSFEEKIIPKPFLIDSKVFTFCSEQKNYKKLNFEEKEFYYWVNYSRNNPKLFFDSVILPIIKIYPQLQGDNLLSLKKDFSNINTLPLLVLNFTLTEMAKKHALDITSHNAIPSHNSTNGDSFADRAKKNKLKTCGGENISYGANKAVFLLALLYLDINVPTLGHRKALLNQSFTETGIGDAFYKNGLIFLVEDFSCSQN